MRRVLRLSVWEYNSPNCESWYYVVIITAHARDNHQYAIAPSVAHVRFQLSRVGDCSSMIVLCDSWRCLLRSCVLVKTSVFTLDGGQGTEPEPKEQFRALFLPSSSRLQPWRSRQPCVVAAVPFLDAGQAVVRRGRCRELLCKKQNASCCKIGSRKRRSWCMLQLQNIKRASREYCLRLATKAKKKVRRATRR